MDREVCAGQIYRHFKDKLYQIVGVAKHSETGEKLVIYQQLYGKYELCARPYKMFISEVDHEKYPKVKQRYRFELVESDEDEHVEINDDKKESHNDLQRVDTDDFEDVEEGVDPALVMFLDAGTYEEKHNVLMRIKDSITDRLINDIATSMDVSVNEGDLETRFESLLACVDMMAKFEVNR